jgi:hypothetical protein
MAVFGDKSSFSTRFGRVTLVESIKVDEIPHTPSRTR